MEIKFLKDHLEHKAGDVVKDHFNAQYLIAVGVAELVKPKTKENVKK